LLGKANKNQHFPDIRFINEVDEQILVSGLSVKAAWMPSVNLGHTLDPRTEGKGFGAKSLGKQTLREGDVKHQMRKNK